jgi:hypothetical protein
MQEHLVSVVVLTCSGREKKLFRCLNSIQSSRYKNIETILVANNCSPTLIKQIKSKFPKVKPIWLPANTGCFGRNVGYANANGKYILSLDDDITIFPETIGKAVEIFERKPEKTAVLALNVYNPQTNHYYGSPSKWLTSFPAAGVMFKKNLLDKVGYYDKDFFLWGEEDDLVLRILDAGYRIEFLKDVIVNHSEKPGKLRKRQIFLNARNKAWLNIKHFSFKFFPLLIARDLVWLFFLPYRKHSLKVLWYCLTGHLLGYFSFSVPWRKRKVISLKIQKRFLKHYWLSDFNIDKSIKLQ